VTREVEGEEFRGTEERLGHGGLREDEDKRPMVANR
jgi:hypothetical protein